MKSSLLITVFLWSLFLNNSIIHANTVESGTKERREKLLGLIHDEMKTIGMVKSKAGPDLQYRYFELMAEKLALIHEEDTEIYLKAAPEEVKKRGGKESYLNNTRKYYSEAKAYGLSLVKNYPKYEKLANIYYTLGLNSRDFGSDGQTENFLQSALRYAPKKSSVAHLANTSMAEFYYNEKKYQAAETYYTTVIQDATDKWRPKHFYNMAWCLLKNKKHDQAIEFLYKSFNEGKKENKVQVKDQVFEALALFHVIGNRIDEVIDFYLKELDDPTDLLIKTAKAAADKGHMAKAERAISEGLRVARAKNRFNQQMDIHLMQLELYRNYKRDDQFFSVSQNIQSLFKKQNNETKIENDKIIAAIDQIQGQTGYLQIRLTENAKKRVVLKDPELLKRVVAYFDILKEIDFQKKTKYEFFKGETFYSVSQFNKALNSYKIGLEYSLEDTFKTWIPNSEDLDFEKKLFGDNLQRKLINGYFSSLEEAKVSEKEQDQYSRFGFETQLKLWPVDEKSQKIYPRLFGLYLKLGEFSLAESVIEKYHQAYQSDLALQQDLVSLLLDKFIKLKKIDDLSRWSFQLEKGVYQYPKDKIETLLTSLGSLLSDNFIKMESAGNSREAAQGHGSLWKNEKYPPVVRGRAAFNASVVYLKLNEVESSMEWLKKAFETLPVDKMKENFSTLNSMIARLQNDFYHLEAESILSHLNKVYCQDKFKEKSSLQELHLQGLIFQGREKNVLDLSLYLETCGLDKKRVSYWQNAAVEQLIKFEKFEEYQKLKALPDYKNLFTDAQDKQVNDHLEDKWWLLHSAQVVQSPKDANSILAEFQNKNFYRGEKIKSELELLMAFDRELDLLIKQTQITPMDSFDPNQFNQMLGDALKQSARFDEIIKTITTGNPELLSYGVIRGMEYWQLLANRIENYPLNVEDKEFVASFRQQMKGIAAKIKEKGTLLERDYHKTMAKNGATSLVWKDRPIKLVQGHQSSGTDKLALEQAPLKPLSIDFIKE